MRQQGFLAIALVNHYHDGKLLETTVLSVVNPDRLDAVVVLVTSTSGNAYYGE